MGSGFHPVLIALLVSHGTPVTPPWTVTRDVHSASWDDAVGFRIGSGTLGDVTRSYRWFRQPARTPVTSP
ncbi:hypothetical protein GCM10028790_51330 [Micromonospora taraxaci]